MATTLELKDAAPQTAGELTFFNNDNLSVFMTVDDHTKIEVVSAADDNVVPGLPFSSEEHSTRFTLFQDGVFLIKREGEEKPFVRVTVIHKHVVVITELGKEEEAEETKPEA